MFLEYDPAFLVYRPRFGQVFTDVRGWRSFASLQEARDVLSSCGLRLGRKTDSRTWEIIAVEEAS